MSAALDNALGSVEPLRPGEDPLTTTLLELVEAISDASNNEREVVATVSQMIRSGRVRLIGTFRHAPRETLSLTDGASPLLADVALATRGAALVSQQTSKRAIGAA